jgi:hypothetical protein
MLDGVKIAELKESRFTPMRGGFQLPSANWCDKFDVPFSKDSSSFEDIATSTKLTLRLNPLIFETTNAYFEYHTEFFFNKAREMYLFYLLNPEE